MPPRPPRPIDLAQGRRVAVVGAGISGLRCAGLLHERGIPVTVFEKSRGTAGRMSTRRVPDQGLQFDHGAQFFTARDPDFRREVAGWIRQGHVARWRGRFGSLEDGRFAPAPDRDVRYVGLPRMSALGRHLAESLDVRTGVRVGRLLSTDPGWRVLDAEDADLGHFDQVIVAVPAPQAAELLAPCPALAAVAAAVDMVPCHALMLHFDQPLVASFDAARTADQPFTWLARDNSKPGRPDLECWVAHSSEAFSRAHLELSTDDVAATLLPAFQAAVGSNKSPTFAVAHRWRYARPARARGSGCLYDGLRGVGVCGDWLEAPRVEAAWSSGSAVAEQVLLAVGR